jgi:peptidyl-prolyl cis-trans isomerase D
VKAVIAPLVKAKEAPTIAVRPMAKDVGDAGVAADATIQTTLSADAGAAAAASIKPKLPTADADPDRPQVQTSSAFNKGGDPIPALSDDATASVTKFAFGAKDGDLMDEPVRADDGFLVVQLKEHKAATKDEFEKDRDTYLQTLLASKQAEALSLYVRRLKEQYKAEIRTDESFVKEDTADGGAPTDLEDEEP